MRLKKVQSIFLPLILLWMMTATCHAFPPQSVEFMPGYTFPDSSSDGAPSFDLRYFLHFPSLYLAAGVGIGRISTPANHRNLAIGSDLEMTPIGFTLRLLPPLSESFVTFVEIGADRLSQLHYRLDPSIDTGETDIPCVDTQQTGPFPCKETTMKKKTLAYRVGVGIEKVFRSGFGVGVHYTYRIAKPLERDVKQATDFGITGAQTTQEDLFNVNQSILSLLISYRFN